MKKNKFKVGSSVYLVYNINGEYFVYEDVLEVNRVSNDKQGYHYSLKNSCDDYIDWCYEDMVFWTHQSAKDAVRKLNSNIGE